jgi:hypothetical protein
MPCLWIHRSSGSHFLVRGDEAELMNLSEQILTEEVSSKNSAFGTRISLKADDFLPERSLYDEISYVSSADAYKMTLWNIFPEDHFRHEDSTFKLPKGFIVRNRDEPYDFTRPIPTAQELDQELSDYFRN